MSRATPGYSEESFRDAPILVIDDDVSLLCMLQNVLGRLGFTRVRTLNNPQHALDAYAKLPADLVITDLHMHGLDGVKLIEQLRAVTTHDPCLPILVITGTQNKQDKRRAQTAGATDILNKPFDPPEILMRIRTLLRTRFLHLEVQDQNAVLEQKVAQRTAALNDALAKLQEAQQLLVQQERLRAFGAMAGGVVHDFNNALMSIIGYSELVLENPRLLAKSETISEYMRVINTAGRNASNVVSRLRDFCRPRQTSDVFTPVEVNELVEEVVQLTRPQWKDEALAGQRTICMDLQLTPVPPIFGNGAELREAVTNLILNGIDAMPEGGTITLGTRAEDGRVVLEISDTGTGMSEEVRLRCLEPFFTTKGKQSNGLGLATVFGVVKRHDGLLEIGQRPERGTTVRLALPCPRTAPARSDEVRLTLMPSVVDPSALPPLAIPFNRPQLQCTTSAGASG
ncbi:MAG: hybrid sensor histidine kinase/response regulator [Verrucomicrobiota bacterium]|nr:hybrid sensor histidine kinase/response regulator [Verrucomicrobiota bacterium]